MSVESEVECCEDEHDPVGVRRGEESFLDRVWGVLLSEWMIRAQFMRDERNPQATQAGIVLGPQGLLSTAYNLSWTSEQSPLTRNVTTGIDMRVI